MSTRKQKFSKSQIDRVGRILRADGLDEESYKLAVSDLNDWRELHLPIMNKYYEKCQEIAKSYHDKNMIVAQRLKRLPTILDKIKRYPEMNLSRLQDVAGVRVVVGSMKDLSEVEKKLLDLNPKNVKNRIKDPKRSGYRSEHFIYEEGGMLVEVQLRTFLQHLWATTVETVDLFRGTSMKTKEVDDPWQEFFALVSSVYAAMEGTPVLPQHRGVKLREILDEMREISDRHNIFKQINNYSKMRVLDKVSVPKETFYVILTVDSEKRKIDCACYTESAYSKAVDEYEKMEAKMRKNSVLVSVSDFRKVKKAYPNYFMDLEIFERLTRVALEEIRRMC